MNQLTKSEFRKELRKICSQPACVDLMSIDRQVEYLINNTEIIPDPVPEVDTELEEAKKRFPVGSWYSSLSFHVAYKVTEVKRRSDYKKIYVCSADGYEYDVKLCTPATLPTAAPKWRCMKTDVENSMADRVVRLDDVNHIGWYDVAKKTWFVRGVYIDLSCYETALWLEIPRGEY